LIHVSAGIDHTCGVASDYRHYCWGNNGIGAVGDGPPATLRLLPGTGRGRDVN
jgi:alpha-tubulin suppressor-like RCC1 family protein